MDSNYKTVAIISDGFRDILKRQRYEDLVLTTINRSNSLIENRPLSKVIAQSNNEPDFLDTKGNKYDVKLLLDSKQGALIGERKNALQQWIYSMLKECGEFNNCFRNHSITNVQNTKLYGILKKRLLSVKADEVAIIFCPFPVVNDFQHAVYMPFAMDFLQAVVNELAEEISVCQGVYFLYPSMEKGILVLRNANTRAREYIESPEISEYICFEKMPI